MNGTKDNILNLFSKSAGIIYKLSEYDTHKIKILKTKRYLLCSVYFLLKQPYAHCEKNIQSRIVLYRHSFSIKIHFRNGIPWIKTN